MIRPKNKEAKKKSKDPLNSTEAIKAKVEVENDIKKNHEHTITNSNDLKDWVNQVAKSEY